jgi:hypothetical protein
VALLVLSGGWDQQASAQAATAQDQAASSPLPAISVTKPAPPKRAAPKIASADPAVGTASSNSATPADGAKSRKPVAARGPKGPYYVDFRARTAASYGHAFVWFGKTSDKKVDVAGLHPAGDEVPFVLGHLVPVPAETGASYGDLDPQYLTANYRVYMNEADGKRVFAYIRKLQSTHKLWNEMTSNCTTFMGEIATFMGLKTPFYLKVPEDYVNELRKMNDDKQFIQLSSESIPGE